MLAAELETPIHREGLHGVVEVDARPARSRTGISGSAAPSPVRVHRPSRASSKVEMPAKLSTAPQKFQTRDAAPAGPALRCSLVTDLLRTGASLAPRSGPASAAHGGWNFCGTVRCERLPRVCRLHAAEIPESGDVKGAFRGKSRAGRFPAGWTGGAMCGHPPRGRSPFRLRIRPSAASRAVYLIGMFPCGR